MFNQALESCYVIPMLSLKDFSISNERNSYNYTCACHYMSHRQAIQHQLTYPHITCSTKPTALVPACLLPSRHHLSVH